MARIRIRGKAKKVKTSEIRAATVFFSDKLLQRLSKNVFIDLKLREGLYKRTGHFGEAMWTDDEARNHREFEVDVDAGLGPVFLFRTLAHEMVHVRQWARNQLIDTRYGNYQKWNGFLINEKLVAYQDLPWEREAHALEKTLYAEWVAFRKKT